MNVKLEVVTLNSCNPLPYAQALKQQFALCETGRVGFALFVSAPVVTLGMRAGLDQLKKDKAYFEKEGIEILPTDRGGLATYHGPGQVGIFPFGSLDSFTGDSRNARDFVCRTKALLKAWIEKHRQADAICEEEAAQATGLWVKSEHTGFKGKIASFGMRFTRQKIAHGIALNLYPDPAGTELGFKHIIACGNADAQTAYVLDSVPAQQMREELIASLCSQLKEY